MKKTTLILILFMCMLPNIYSQNILDQLKKYNLKKIENKAVRKTRKRMDIPKNKKLSAMTCFYVATIKDYNQDTGTVSELLSNLELVYYKFTSFVYDDSLNVLSTVLANKQVFQNVKPELCKYYLLVRFFKKVSPDYIMELLLKSDNFPSVLYLYYKENHIYFAYMSEDKTKIISYPLDEVKDWRWFNPEMR